MTRQLREVMARVTQWPEERQDEAARVLLDLEAQQTRNLRLTPQQVAEVERIRRDLRDGSERLATDEEMAEFWKSCGL